jgi:hypothetical protein
LIGEHICPARVLDMLKLYFTRIAKVYNEGAEKIGAKGRLFGIEGDVRQKVCTNVLAYQ